MLQGELQRLTDRLTVYQERFQAAQAALAKERATLSTAKQACDEVLKKIQALTITIDSMAPDVNLDAVGPVNAWAGKYGERGTLTAFLKQLLQDAYPSSLTIQEVCLAVHDLAPVSQDTDYSQCSACPLWARRCCLNSLGDFIFSAECGCTSLKCSKAAAICAITVLASARFMRLT